MKHGKILRIQNLIPACHCVLFLPLEIFSKNITQSYREDSLT